jgi:uncharacterized protein (TIGR02246 family)
MKNRVLSAFARSVIGVSMGASPLGWTLGVAGTSGCHRVTTAHGAAERPSRSVVDEGARGGESPGSRDETAIAAAIAAVLMAQRDAWNRGDLDAFMDAYVRDDALVFTSGGKVRRGWDETMRRYRARYVDAAAMGKLTFDGLETTVIADDAALVLGWWRLVDTPEAGHGLFTLLFVRRDGRWLILHDHTSADVDDRPRAAVP